MKGYAKPLHEFIEGHKIQFVIPVYQRNYDWLIDNCDQLFSDLVKLSRSNRCSHFFGSIVTSSVFFVYSTNPNSFKYPSISLSRSARLASKSLISFMTA